MLAAERLHGGPDLRPSRPAGGDDTTLPLQARGGTKTAPERSLRGVALGRRSWLFAGSERGGHRAAFMDTLIGSAKLNGIDLQAWLADVIARISDLPISRLPELLAWNWQRLAAQSEKAA